MALNPPLRLGTRGSRLALWQAHHVRDRLAALSTPIPVEIVVIETSGDRIQDVPLSTAGGRDFFTKDIEQAIVDDRIDFAVHSLKDLATRLPDGLVLAAALDRADPRDALVLPKGAGDAAATGLDALPRGAKVGTSSLRRVAFLRAARPDVELAELRGNVPTRLGKLDDGNYDAILLAAAGLDRLGMGDRISHRIDPDVMTPAPSQGTIGLEARADDERTLEALAHLQHDATRAAVDAERALLRSLDGGCSVPIGAFAQVSADRLSMHARVASLDGTTVVKGDMEGAVEDAAAMGRTLARGLDAEGASELLAAVRAEVSA